MGYVLKKGKISDLAPNHPFAHDQISFVPNPGSSPSNLSEKSNSAPQDPEPEMAQARSAYERQAMELAEKAQKLGR